MAAMMSRAFAFSPLAIVETGEAWSGWEVTGSRPAVVAGSWGVASSAVEGVVLADGSDLSSAAGGSAAAGLAKRESNSVGWRWEAFSRETCDGG